MSDADVTHRKGGRRRQARATLAEVEQLGKEGERFGRFFVVERLGAGGMGVVIAAYDPDLDRKVAIKVLRPDGVLARQELREQMIREAQAMARLQHPNVVAVHEVGTVERSFFIVMELVEGGTLKRWMEAPRPWRDVVRTLVQAGRGLAAAHAHGLVHRDFKPHNVLVGRDGRVRVTDFGVVGVAGTSDGLAVGTPIYMAPEQHTPAVVDARADQFAFCATLYEALYGVPPFLEELAVHAGPPAQPSGADVPARIHAVIARGLAASPDARFASMEELLAALQQDPRRRWRAAMIGALVLALAGLAALGWSRKSVVAAAEIDPCRATAATLDAAWNPTVRSTTAGAFQRALPSLGAETLARIAPRLDGYAGAWATERAKACAAPTGGALECLERRREHFAALTDVLARAGDKAIVENAVAAVASLEPPRECTTITQHAPTLGPAPGLGPLRARLDQARSFLDAGLGQRAVEIARDALAHADSPEAEAQAALLLGRALRDSDDGGAREALVRAVRAASASGMDDVVARAYTELAWVTSYLEGKPGETLAMSPFVDAAVARAGSPAQLRAAAEFATGSALVELGKYPEARTHLDAADKLWRTELDPTHPEAARVLLTLGNVMSYEGDFAGAERAYREVVRLRETNLGPHHPALAGPLANLGDVVLDRGDATSALALCRRSLELSTGSRVNALRCIGRAAGKLGRTADAVASLTQAVDLAEHAPNGQVAYALVDLGELMFTLGDLEKARTSCERALDQFSGELATHPDRSIPLRCKGRVLLAKGDAAAAREDLEDALALIGDGGTAVHRGELKFLLAQTLRSLALDPAQQRELATQAAAEFAAIGAKDRAAEITAWLGS